MATIRDYIKGDLRARPDPGAELTLAALAGRYGVSFTPVREAIRDLVAEGVLVRQAGGRVRFHPDRAAAGAGAEPPEPPRGAEALEEDLAAEVIARSLRGDDGYLREEATAERFGVGRTAIRQAFGRLAGRGLIVHVPRCGWRVRPFDMADLDAYLDVRERLELRALDLARPHLDPADLRRMLAGNAPAARPPRLDNGLHRYLIDRAGNPYIRDFFDRQGAYYTTLFDFAAPGTSAVAAMGRQHRAVLRALLDRDWRRARRELARHIRAQRPIVRDLMARLNRTPADHPNEAQER